MNRFGFVLALAFIFLGDMNAIGAEGRPLGAGVVGHAFGGLEPRVSPDGSEIVLSWQGSIWRMSIEGGTMTRLTAGGGGGFGKNGLGVAGFAVEPCWSPDGKSIVYVNSLHFGGGKLKRIRARDGAEEAVPGKGFVNGKMFWHPDGRRLLGKFMTGGTELLEQVGWYDLETGEVEVIEALRVNEQIRPRRRLPFALSGDGEWMYYATHRDVTGEQGGNDGHDATLWRVHLPKGKPERFGSWPSRVYDMSVDGANESLFVTTNRGGAHNDLWRVPLDDPFYKSVKITRGQADEDRSTLLGDGRTLVYTDNHNGPTSIVKHDLETGIVRPMVVDRFDYGVETGRVRLEISDKGTGEACTASVSFESLEGVFYAPPGALYREQLGVMHYYATGESVMNVPAGKYRVSVRRGTEYRVVYEEVEVVGGKEAVVGVELERWVHAAKEGWYSGENHIHANYGYGPWYNTPPDVLEQCDGENLNVCNIMVANSDTDGVYDRRFFTGKVDGASSGETLLYWNQEFRSTFWGHMTLINLEQLVEPIFTGFKGTTHPHDVPTNSDIADRTHEQKGLVSYTHPASHREEFFSNPYSARGAPMDAAFGKLDALDVMGGGYVAGIELWYKMLNCGFRLSGAAGTDCFLNRVSSRLPGWGRCYVKVEGDFSYGGWVEGLRAGRSFVSNGPMLEVTVEGREIGADVKVVRGKVRVQVEARSQYPIDLIEVIYNGKVARAVKVEGDKLVARFDGDVEVGSSGWVAVRMRGGRAPFSSLGATVAHSSPVYLEVTGKAQDSSAEAQFFLDWIDQHEAEFIERDRAKHDKERVLEMYDAAREVYRKILKR